MNAYPPGEPHQSERQAVLAAFGGLLDKVACLERTEQTESSGLVHSDLCGQLADPSCAPACQQLEDMECSIDRLQPARTGVGVGVRSDGGLPEELRMLRTSAENANQRTPHA